MDLLRACMGNQKRTTETSLQKGFIVVIQRVVKQSTVSIAGKQVFPGIGKTHSAFQAIVDTQESEVVKYKGEIRASGQKLAEGQALYSNKTYRDWGKNRLRRRLRKRKPPDSWLFENAQTIWNLPNERIIKGRREEVNPRGNNQTRHNDNDQMSA